MDEIKKVEKKLKSIPVKDLAIGSAGLVAVGFATREALQRMGVLDKIDSFRLGPIAAGRFGIAAINGALAASSLSYAGMGAGAAEMALILGPGSEVLNAVRDFMAGIIGETDVTHFSADVYGASDNYYQYEQQLENVGFAREEVPKGLVFAGQ